MSEPLLRIRNKHSPACGDPPIVDSDNPNVYIGYFENEYGEQWVFTYDRSTCVAEIRGGDTGWNTVYAVEEGQVAELILNIAEKTWLASCWLAATGG